MQSHYFLSGIGRRESRAQKNPPEAGWDWGDLSLFEGPISAIGMDAYVRDLLLKRIPSGVGKSRVKENSVDGRLEEVGREAIICKR